MKFEIVKDRSFYKDVFKMAIPIALQNLITNIVNLADTVMLGRADSSGKLLSASSIANQPFFLLTMICFGLASAATVLNSQYWGKKNLDAIRKIISMTLRLVAVFGVILSVMVLVFPKFTLGLYTDRPDIIEEGTKYVAILGWVYLLFALSSAMQICIRSVEIVHVALVTNICTLFINISLNWVLIFGNLGAPALGIRGAAIATLVSRVVEFIITFVYVFFIDKKLAFRIKHLRLWKNTLFKDLVKFGSPVFINEVMWGFGMTLLMSVLGHITYCSGDPVAADSLANSVHQIAIVLIFGFAGSASVFVGKAIGEGRLDEAKRRAHSFDLIAVIIGIISMLAVFFLRTAVADLFGVVDETRDLAIGMLAIIAYTTFFTSFSANNIMGVLRGGGDTKFCLIIEFICLWGIALPVGFTASKLQWPILIVYALLLIDEPLKVLITYIRRGSDKWLKIVTRDDL